MPFFTYEPKVGSDWQYEQVRSEIKRLREVLHNPDLTAQERIIALSQLADYLARKENAAQHAHPCARARENRWTEQGRKPTVGIDLGGSSQLSWVPLSIAV